MRITTRHSLCSLAAACLLTALGCNSSATPHTPAATASPAATQPPYPPRPTIPAPAFKLFHHDTSSITLTTTPGATDAQIAALIWQLHDASRAHSFDQLGIPQKLVDARDPILWFHIYRGSKCASEKYTSGPLPCGASYHAAGDYTLGGFTNHNHDDGVLLHADGSQTELWNPNTPAAK
jgi:hypothetical protein